MIKRINMHRPLFGQGCESWLEFGPNTLNIHGVCVTNVLCLAHLNYTCSTCTTSWGQGKLYIGLHLVYAGHVLFTYPRVSSAWNVVPRIWCECTYFQGTAHAFFTLRQRYYVLGDSKCFPRYCWSFWWIVNGFATCFAGIHLSLYMLIAEIVRVF